MNKLKKLRKFFKIYKLDGYLVPKNDEYFNEYVNPSKDRLKFISNFSGSAGFGIITIKKKLSFRRWKIYIASTQRIGKKF